MSKLRAVIEVEYEPEPKYYRLPDADPDEPDPSPEEMAAIDEENWAQDPMMLVASFEADEFTVKVFPV